MSPELMYRHPAVFAGRPLNFREASFLSNARTPSWVRHAATAISSGTPLGCEGGAKCAQALSRKPPEGVNQQVSRAEVAQRLFLGKEGEAGWLAGDIRAVVVWLDLVTVVTSFCASSCGAQPVTGWRSLFVDGTMQQPQQAPRGRELAGEQG
jgi:hypothetical protein